MFTVLLIAFNYVSQTILFNDYQKQTKKKQVKVDLKLSCVLCES